MSSSPPLDITNLASTEAAIRVISAAEIYNQGLALAEPVVTRWLADREFSRLLWDQRLVTVGLAVSPDTFTRIRQANGNPRLAIVPVELDVEEFELRFPAEISLDILTSRDPNGEGAIARYLKRFGEGIQQVEYRCADVDRATAILKERFDVSPIYPQKRPGGDDTRVNFILAMAPDGRKVLVELYEAAEARR